MTDPAAFHVRLQLDARSSWRWTEIAKNNSVIGASSESFTRFDSALDNLLATMPGYVAQPIGLPDLPPGNPQRVITVKVPHGRCPRCGEERVGVPESNPDAIVCQRCWDDIEAEAVEDGET